MTNRDMVKGKGTVKDAGTAGQEPNAQPLPPMPAPEDAAGPTTREDPIDSPQPNASAERDAPRAGKDGLATRR